MKNKALILRKIFNRSKQFINQSTQVQLGYGLWFLLFIFVGLSFLATFDFSPATRLFGVDEVATHDVAADRSFIFENNEATRHKKEQVRALAPLVADLNLESIGSLNKRIDDIFAAINQAHSPESLEALRLSISDELSEDLPFRAFEALKLPDVHRLIYMKVLPWVEQRLREGVISDTRLLLSHRGGIIIRNLSTGEETVRSDAYSVPGLKDLEVDINLLIRALDAPPSVKKGISILFSGQILPTLSPNYEATALRIAEAELKIDPVVRHIRQGEIIVRQGETVTPDRYKELHALWERQTNRFQYTRCAGIFVIAVLLSFGLFSSPSGKRGSRVSQKDLLFIGTLVAVFALLAKGLSLIGHSLALSSTEVLASGIAYAVPVAGAAALAAMIISTRRYYSISLLVSFFCTIMVRGSLGIFLFYFLSCLFNTWLITRSLSRQDFVRSFLPLLIALYAMWIGATFLHGGAHTRYLAEALAVLSGVLLSMLFTFALAPVVEMVFGYTTRFLLMELMNLEQPLLRELMLNAPGTYHHALIVSNMVEAGAKSIGAHSLLCKVGALYHDIGKIEKPSYFIENQFNSDNPHDKLTPTLSALVITSHVKRGIDMAQQYHLGEAVTDIIRQHHGTGAIRYFYQKALKDNPGVQVEDFSYPGPRPQTREAALVMLADAVEASSRTLEDPTPSRIKAHIHGIIRGILADGQLEEADLTFRDLDKVAESFNLILNGIFHHRIEYPDRVPLKPVMDVMFSAEKLDGTECPAAQWLSDDVQRRQQSKQAHSKKEAQSE